MQDRIQHVDFGKINVNCKRYRHGLILNIEDDGTAQTIKSQYHKSSLANFTRRNTFGATGIIQVVENDN